MVAQNMDMLYAGKKLWNSPTSNKTDRLRLTALTCSLLPLQHCAFTGSILVTVSPALQVGVKLASLVAVDLASPGAVAVDLASLGVGMGVLHTAHGRIIKE